LLDSAYMIQLIQNYKFWRVALKKWQ
jgi:hypothetical protein